MRSRAAWLLAPLAAGFAWGVLHLFGVEFAAGSVYPPYSSLRADPDGARLLFDSLARIPGLAVTRNYLPLELLEPSGATVLLLGLDARRFPEDMDLLRQARRLAERGNRVILAAGPLPGPAEVPAGKLNREWGVCLAADWSRGAAHRLYFSQAEDWMEVGRAGGKVLAVERPFGKGVVRLMAESLDFDNQASIAMDRLDEVLAAIGPNPRIIFDEQHFGITESGSVIGLARRFRLSGMALGLLLVAVLWIWRNGAAFPPAAPAAAVERLEGRTSQAGLLTLLRRHIAPRDLPSVCWQQWLAANRRAVTPEAQARVAAILAGSADPVGKMRELGSITQSRGRAALVRAGQEAHPT